MNESWFPTNYLLDIFLPMSCLKTPYLSTKCKKSQEYLWAERVDFNTFIYFGTIIILIILNMICNFEEWYGQTLKYDENIPIGAILLIYKLVQDDLCWILQLIFVNVQLILIIGLYFDGEKSFTTKFFKTSFIQVTFEYF